MNNPILLSGKSDKSLMVFNNTNFGSIRTVELNGKIYFCGKDVAGALGYKETSKAIREHCKGVSKIDIPTKGGIQETSFIPEGDVYRLITSSKLPTAEKFESWVFDEVLPSIRKNGGYIENQENLTDEQLMAKALLVAQNVIAKKDATIEEMKPKAECYDELIDATGLFNLQTTAKMLGVNFNWFKNCLMDNEYLYRGSHDTLLPYANRKNIFVVKEWTRNGIAGFQTLVTPKGTDILRALFKVWGKDKDDSKKILEETADAFIEKSEAEYQKIIDKTSMNYIEKAIENCPPSNNTILDKKYSFEEVAKIIGESQITVMNFCKAKGWLNDQYKPYSHENKYFTSDGSFTEDGKNYVVAAFFNINKAEKGMRKTSLGLGEQKKKMQFLNFILIILLENFNGLLYSIHSK